MVKEILMHIGIPSVATATAIYECPNGATATIVSIKVANSNISVDGTFGLYIIRRSETATVGAGNAIVDAVVVPAAFGSKEYRVFIPMSEGDRLFSASSGGTLSYLVTGILRS